MTHYGFVLFTGFLTGVSQNLPMEIESPYSQEKKKTGNISSAHRKHSCVFCGKGFSRKLFLERHQRVHTGDRPFQCSVCLKQFSQKANLNRHMMVHASHLL